MLSLSYTWGPPEFNGVPEKANTAPPHQSPLICDGMVLQVQDNLLDFLKVVAKKAAQPRLIWVDAVCINLANHSERSKQVALMGQIYKNASQVVVWLGRNDPHENVLWVNQAFAPAFLEAFPDDSDEAWLRQSSAFCDDSRIVERLGQEFSRGWVIQEVTLVDYKQVFLLSGGEFLDWSYLLFFTGKIQTLGWYLQLGEVFPKTWFAVLRLSTFSHFLGVLNLGYIAPSTGLLSTSLDILYGASLDYTSSWYVKLSVLVSGVGANVTDPRDHIYSWLGLALEALPTGMENPIVPDYRLSTAEVYAGFTSLILQNTRYLYHLSCVADSSHKVVAGLPSWVPDYSIPSEERAYSLMAFRSDSTIEKVFDAAKIKEFNSYRPSTQENKLFVHGVCLDVIVDQGPNPLEMGHPLYLLEYCVAENSAYELTDEPRTWAMIRTIIADEPLSHLGPSGKAENFQLFLRDRCAEILYLIQKDHLLDADTAFQTRLTNALSQVSKSAMLQSTLPTLEEVMTHLEQGEELLHSKSPLLLLIETFGRHRRMYKTAKGYLGLGPKSLLQGDEVWLLMNSHVPFILRRDVETGTFRLIGETYVHGVMYGEAMTDEFVQKVGLIEII
ncbi:hypothetical protein ACEPPN_011190 [Leptodophora sp. 'Broadleaf-Isolate-01']